MINIKAVSDLLTAFFLIFIDSKLNKIYYIIMII